VQSKSAECRRKTLVPSSLKQLVEGLRKDVVSFRQKTTFRPYLGHGDPGLVHAGSLAAQMDDFLTAKNVTCGSTLNLYIKLVRQ
jgi:hypothetical protein